MDPKRCFKDSNLGHAAYACSLPVNTCTPDTGTEYLANRKAGYRVLQTILGDTYFSLFINSCIFCFS